MKSETACLHAVRDTTHSTGAVATPIYQTATFAHPAFGQSTGYDYSRSQNPTREHLEKLVAALEGGSDAIAFSTGMAAIATVMELFKIGDELIATEDLYGGSIRLFNYISQKNGIGVHYADTANLAAVKALITDKTKAIFIESPTNPMMLVTDIAAVKELVKGRDILIIVDNTFLTPYFCKPIELGADIVIHSGTKYLSGHNDTLAGFAVTAKEELAERIRFLTKTTGAVLAPFDSFLVTRGIKTLAIRLEKAQQNAIGLAEWLKKHPKVKSVNYVGLPEHPSYELSKRQGSGFGAMISFSVDTAETARTLLERINLILYAESLGGVETLMTYPATQTHADVPEAERIARGIDDRLLRLSAGIEALEDLIEDLEAALA
ncbi:MAG: PLP-dependent aspartate aminotransferase family protein [Oscillospiraceae bacterium]|jgi:cystathionine gamma-synthase|nr:PLP-dependent aspartate aminotransferase family protein [Oscillospiraceae bacterium]